MRWPRRRYHSVLILLLCGCRSSSPLPEEPLSLEVERLPVALSNELRELEIQAQLWAGKATVDLGEALEIFFRHDEEAPVKLDHLNSHLVVTADTTFGDTAQCVVSLKVQRGDVTHVVDGFGFVQFRSARRGLGIAVKKAALDLYQKVKALTE